MPETYETRVSAAGRRVRSASVSHSFGGGIQAALEVYGDAPTPDAMTWQLLKNGAVIAEKTYALNGGAQSGGLDKAIGSYRGVQSEPEGLGSFSETPAQYIAQSSYDSELGDSYEGTAPSEPVDTEAKLREALSDAGYSLVITDGAGVWRGQPPGEFGYQDVDTLSYLQSTLAKTGARFWVEGSTVYLDGSALAPGFALGADDLALLPGYSWQEEFSDLEPPVAGEPPNRDDYLSQCEDHEPPEGYEPPEQTPETVRQGTFVYESTVGTGFDAITVIRKNTYNRRLLKTEVIERGYVDTPNGKQLTDRVRTLSEFFYHAKCPDAVVRTVETTWIAPSMSTVTGATVENAEEIYNALAAIAPYVQSERTEQLEYHGEGWLKRTTEITKEIEVLTYTAGETFTVQPEYNVRTRSIVYEPHSGGVWSVYNQETQTESLVTYEKSGETAAPATVQRSSRTTNSVEHTDAAPPQMTCPPPNEPEEEQLEQGEEESCLDYQERLYQEALAKYNADEQVKTDEYNSQAANIQNQDKRVHNLEYGVPRLDLGLNDALGGGIVASYSHQYQDGQGATSSVTVWERV